MSKIESMKAELEAAKYDISGDGLSVTVIEPKSGWQIDCSFYSHAIEIAYAHLLREKKFTAMEAYLTEVYELILSRAGAEQAQGVKLSFASCLPTPLLIKLEKLLGKE